ncbi:amino acid adenylation domain-containing protein, partial [Peribacillus simplex]|uniref:amino acid adenylation domain-containing protein n=1 Tax=Peribacillus simplex TaxID=1478 RepID=UPI003D2B521B
MFVNTLAIRTAPRADRSFREYLQEVKEVVLQAHENQEYPFEDLVNQLNIERETSRHPLFDTMFTIGNSAEEYLFPQSLTLKNLMIESRTSKFDLSMYVEEGVKNLQVSFEYSKQLFKRETITRLELHFKYLLDQLLHHADTKISKVEILTQDEFDAIINRFNASPVDYPSDQSLVSLVEDMVARYPETTALKQDDVMVTYESMSKKSNQLARALQKKGVNSETLVGVIAERSIDTVIAFLGILKAGGAYIPIDPASPNDRMLDILNDSECSILLCAEEKPTLVFDGTILNVNSKSIADESSSQFNYEVNPNNLACVIYTSGSAGKPKGVMVEHRGIVRLVKNSRYIPYKIGDKMLQTSSMVFDASHCEVWGSLVNGMELVFVSQEDLLHPLKMRNALQQNQINHLNLVTPLFNHLVQEASTSGIKKVFGGIDSLIVGGEVLSVKFVNKIKREYPNLVFINSYGPTENSTSTTTHFIEKEYEHTIPIGSPIDNTQVLVLNVHGQLQPMGIIGELCVAGDGLARGYLNNPVLTAEKFTEHPLEEGERLYKTGDLVKWLPDGTLEYLGRMDHQVKIRGYRIELGEIKENLLSLSDISEALVVAIKGQNDEQHLVAYYTLNEGCNVQVSTLRDYLKNNLPGYMVPSHYMELKKFPVNSSGKVNRKALPLPDTTSVTYSMYSAPSIEMEFQLVKLWKEILKVDACGIDDHFFDMGGHSLRATQLTFRIYEDLGIELPLRYVFRYPTIRELAAYMKGLNRSLKTSILSVEEQEDYPTSLTQQRIYVVNQMDEHSVQYNMPFAIKLYGELHIDRLKEAFLLLIRRHEGLRTSFEMKEGLLRQTINEEIHFDLQIKTILTCDVQKEIKRFIRPFDLSKAPLLRAELLYVGENERVLMLDMHHIISDGSSMQIIFSDAMRLYKGEVLEALPLQYKDYANWQLNQFSGNVLKEQEKYWIQKFDNVAPMLNLPTDYKRPAVQQYNGDHYTFELDEELTSELKNVMRAEKVTLYTLLLAAFKVLLHKYSQQDDIVVGSPIEGRTRPEVTGIVGMFANTLAIRTNTHPSQSFRSYLKEVKETVLEAQEHQEYPIEELISHLEIPKDSSKAPLFNVVFSLLNKEVDLVFGERAVILDTSTKTTKFDLTWGVLDNQEKLEITIEYNVLLFSKQTVRTMSERFVELLKDIVSETSKKIMEMNWISDDEKQNLTNFNEVTSHKIPVLSTVIEMFEERQSARANHIAIWGEKDNLTYHNLNRKANRLAHRLKTEGISTEDVIGILSGPHPDMIVGILAVLKAGAAYLPIDPNYPVERINFMLADSRASALLIHPACQ